MRKQRNLYATLAICSIAAIAFAVPRKVASYRELKSANTQLVALQRAIVEEQRQIREVQEKIVKVQQEIRSQVSR